MFQPKEARETMPCPFARTFAEKKGPNCMAEHCPLWRWMPLRADDPKFRAAVQDAISEIATEKGKKPGPGFHKQAVERVMDNREALGLPTSPTHGYCGAGGKPDG